MARNTWAARELILQLTKRDLFAQFKKSYVGITWMLAGPIMAVMPWLFASGVGVYNPGEIAIPLTVYLVVGRTMWSIFNSYYGCGSSTLGSGGALLKQINYPHEAMLAKQVLTGSLSTVLQLATCVAIMVIFGVYPGWGLLLFPLTLLPLFFLGAAMGLIIGMIGVVAYDLNRLIGMLWGFAMWTTPLLYSNKVPNRYLQTLITYNPLTYLVCSARDMLIHNRLYENQVGIYFLCAGVSLLLFLVSLRLFHVSEHKLIERMI